MDFTGKSDKQEMEENQSLDAGKKNGVSPFIPGRSGRTYLPGSKPGSVVGDSDLVRPAAGMTSVELHQRPGGADKSKPESNGESFRTVDHNHVPGYTGNFHHAGNLDLVDHAAGISSMEICHDEHEHEFVPLAPRPEKVRDTVADLLHAHSHGHPDHIIELDDDRESVASDASEFGYLATHQAKGKTVIRGGKLIHLPREVEESPPPAGVASLVHARSTSVDLLKGPPASPANGNGNAKVSGHGGRFCLRGGKLVKVAGEDDDKLRVAGVRTGELSKDGGRGHVETPKGNL